MSDIVEKLRGAREFLRKADAFIVDGNDSLYGSAADEIERLRARVAELEAAQEWRPIDSAPKTPNDSTIAVELLGWCPDKTSPIGGDRRTIWWEPRLRGGCWYSDRDMVEQPTMWTDLPASPKVAL